MKKTAYQIAFKILFRKLKLPRNIVYSILRIIKIVLHPYTRYQVRQESKNIEPPDNRFFIDRNLGYQIINTSDISGIENLIKKCQSLHESYSIAQYNNTIKNKRKEDFLITIAKDKELLQCEEIRSVVGYPPLVNAIANYLGEIPVLHTVRLWLSPPNDSTKSSQLFHFDEEDSKQVKLFINITPMGPEYGPFTFINANKSLQFLKMHKRRYPDELIFKRLSHRDITQLSEHEKSVGLVDTSRCLHYGSRFNKINRLLLMAQYIRHGAPCI